MKEARKGSSEKAAQKRITRGAASAEKKLAALEREYRRSTLMRQEERKQIARRLRQAWNEQSCDREELLIQAVIYLLTDRWP